MNTRIQLSLFPSELLLHIGSFILFPSDLFHFLLTCRRFTSLFHTTLYIENVRNWFSSSLLWACRTGSLETVRHALEAGASPNMLFFEDQRKLRTCSQRCRHSKLWLPPAIVRHLMTIPLAATPLSLAAQHRHPDIVRLLLEKGADASGMKHSDRAPARDHLRVWKPLHWALSCGRFYNSHSSTTTAAPMQVSVEIVAALLDAGADPNALTLVGPARGRQHYTTSAEPTIPLAMASCCAHAPAEVVRLLLNAGADPRVHFSTAGCAGSMRGSSDLLYWLKCDEAVVKDGGLERDRKLLYLLKVEDRKSGRIGTLVLSGEKVERMLALATSARVEIASILWEVPSRVTVSGVYALLDIWVREREAIGRLGDGAIEPAAETLKGLERLVAMILGFRDIVYLDRKIARRATRIDLGVEFLKLCDNPATGNIEEFVRLLESQGLFRDRAGSALSVSEAVQQKFEMFQTRRGTEYPYNPWRY